MVASAEMGSRHKLGNTRYCTRHRNSEKSKLTRKSTRKLEYAVDYFTRCGIKLCHRWQYWWLVRYTPHMYIFAMKSVIPSFETPPFELTNTHTSPAFWSAKFLVRRQGYEALWCFKRHVTCHPTCAPLHIFIVNINPFQFSSGTTM